MNKYFYNDQVLFRGDFLHQLSNTTTDRHSPVLIKNNQIKLSKNKILFQEFVINNLID